MKITAGFEEFEKKGESLFIAIDPYLAPLGQGETTLIPDAPPEIVKLRDEFLEWREEYHKRYDIKMDI
ncbi:hypothetical protein [Granulicatella seriolae]|uniref:Uncharacterized protein n=1 Tax=Granulicatella seriolae TaxID=2967226 RepID=A0ABT1WPL1_9LACT|nr:hypothetical protein [Granulicatella seriolae]